MNIALRISKLNQEDPMNKEISQKKLDLPDTIQMFAGRPIREKIINQEDILNLRIALNIATSIDDFLLMV